MSKLGSAARAGARKARAAAIRDRRGPRPARPAAARRGHRRAAQHRILEVDQPEPLHALALGEPVQVGRMEVAQRPGLRLARGPAPAPRATGRGTACARPTTARRARSPAHTNRAQVRLRSASPRCRRPGSCSCRRRPAGLGQDAPMQVGEQRGRLGVARGVRDAAARRSSRRRNPRSAPARRRRCAAKMRGVEKPSVAQPFGDAPERRGCRARAWRFRDRSCRSAARGPRGARRRDHQDGGARRRRASAARRRGSRRRRATARERASRPARVVQAIVRPRARDAKRAAMRAASARTRARRKSAPRAGSNSTAISSRSGGQRARRPLGPFDQRHRALDRLVPAELERVPRRRAAGRNRRGRWGSLGPS